MVIPSPRLCPRVQTYLSADTRGGITEGQDGHILGPVQPGHSDLGAGGPLHHGDVILPENTNKSVSRANRQQKMATPLLGTAVSVCMCGVLKWGHSYVGSKLLWVVR